ncbi:MAG TPA: hypothetical protein VLF88_01250 [Candidatus Babeliales bacterium]|nr:hypothetical protein [Candidatus Babeliales bacterium]
MKKIYLAVFAVLSVITLAVSHNLAGASSPAEYTGTVREVHGDNFTDKHAENKHYVLDTTKAVYNLALPSSSNVEPGQKVKLHGQVDGNKLVVAQGSLSATNAATSATVSGVQKVAALLINFTNDRSQPFTTSEAYSTLFTDTRSVNAFYKASSNGQVSLTGDVYGWYSLNLDNTTCDYPSWKTAADAAATAAGVNLAAYTNVVYEFPYTASCNWGGLGYMPGNYSWINGGGGYNFGIISHELGHNFGVNHANSENCTDSNGVRVTLSAACTSTEYGDPFSIMGNSGNNLHTNWHRAQLGWLAPQVITASGQYVLPPMTRNVPGRLLSVARGDGTYFQLEYRGFGDPYFDIFSSSDPVANGLTIRLTPDTSSLVQSQLLDTTPETTSFDDAPLLAGKTFTDSANNISITVLSVAGYDGATVKVQFGNSSGADTQAPSTPVNLTAKLASNKKTVNLAWSASADNVGVVGYKVYRNGVLLKQITATSTTDSPAKGSWTYTVAAYDAAGNVSSLSNAATVKL